MVTKSENASSKQSYIGRFAPSPTGPLHYGSLVAAVASYLQARKNNGKWLVRIEDIDPLREIRGATTDILNTLEAFQFEWRSKPLYQSTRFDSYHSQLNKLINKDLIYACSCTRKQIGADSEPSKLGQRYKGTCQNKALDVFNQNYNIRIRVGDTNIHFVDNHFGEQNINLLKTVGDFIVYRKNNLPSYAFAVSVDDAYQNITEVVRGKDLLPFTPLQIYICRQLDFQIPGFLHIPIITNKQGFKLSKQTGASALSIQQSSLLLAQALTDLGQDTPMNLRKEKIENIWQWAFENWQKDKIPNATNIASSL